MAFFYKRKKHPTHAPVPVIGLVGSRGSVESFIAWVSSFTPTQTKAKKHGNIFQVHFTSQKARAIASRLYASTPSLDRKAVLAESFR
jgi:hypothetical protein